MYDPPEPAEILAAAATLLHTELIPALPPEQAFKARVLANALSLVQRQLSADPSVAADVHARLATLTGSDGEGDAPMLEAALSAQIEEGDRPLGDLDLLEYLWRSTLGKIAVDQPRYASFLAETGRHRD
jgi:hypothetical protein